MRKPLTRDNIVDALIVAVYDQSQTHERDDENVIHRFLTEIDRASWIELTISDYRAACCTIDESGAAEASGGVCDACDGGFAWRAHACPACNGAGTVAVHGKEEQWNEPCIACNGRKGGTDA